MGVGKWMNAWREGGMGGWGAGGLTNGQDRWKDGGVNGGWVGGWMDGQIGE